MHEYACLTAFLSVSVYINNITYIKNIHISTY